MPSGAKRPLGVLVIAGSASFLIFGCGGGTQTTELPTPVVDSVARNQIAAINKYLGTSSGAGASDATLLENIINNNNYLRAVIKDLQCDIWKLEHPGQNPGPTCPPGPPSTSPTVPPKYPS